MQVRYDYEEVVPSVAGGGFGIDVSGSNVSAPYEMVSLELGLRLGSRLGFHRVRHRRQRLQRLSAV